MAFTWMYNPSIGDKISKHHMLELQTKINTERSRRAIGAYSFMAIENQVIIPAHFADARSAMAAIDDTTATNWTPPEIHEKITVNYFQQYKNQLDTWNNQQQVNVYSWVYGGWIGDDLEGHVHIGCGYKRVENGYWFNQGTAVGRWWGMYGDDNFVFKNMIPTRVQDGYTTFEMNANLVYQAGSLLDTRYGVDLYYIRQGTRQVTGTTWQ